MNEEDRNDQPWAIVHDPPECRFRLGTYASLDVYPMQPVAIHFRFGDRKKLADWLRELAKKIENA